MLRRLPDFLILVSRFCLRTLLDFYRGYGLNRSASLAYTLLLAMVPLSILIIDVVSFFPLFNTIIATVEVFVFDNFVPHTGAIVLQALEEFQGRSHRLPWISVGFLAVTSYFMLSTMEAHLNALWDLKRRRFFGLSFLIHWLILIIGPLLLCLSLAVSSFLSSLPWLQTYHFFHFLFLLPFVCSFLAYVFLYLTLPHCSVKIRYVLIGSFVAALLFEIAKIAFSFYAKIVPTYTIIYGALAVVPLFLIWLYVSCVIFLIGGQIVNTLRIGQNTHPGSRDIAK